MSSVNPPSDRNLGLIFEITPSARFIEWVAEQVKASDPVTGLPMDEMVIKLRDSIGIDSITNAIVDSISAGDIAEELDTSSIAEEVASSLDMYEISANIDISDVAEYVSTSDVAEYIDLSSLAEEIEVDTDTIVEALNYKRLAKAIIEELTRGAKIAAETKVTEEVAS